MRPVLLFSLLAITANPCNLPEPPGQAIFEREFTVETGLGPLFNAPSCLECHENGGAGGSGDEDEFQVALGCPDSPTVLQAFAIPPAEVEAVPDTASLRSSNDLFGLGIIDQMTDEEILSRADPLDLNDDTIRGFANFLSDGRLGRFGRKAQAATLREFVRGAFQAEIGVSVPDELTEAEVSEVTDFVASLVLDGVRGHGRGKALFRKLDCVVCHVPPVYTDVLMHDVGPQKDLCIGSAGENYFRTEPLMGLRHQERFMHDGKSASIEEAILRHFGEADRARRGFLDLDAREREALLSFLGEL